MSEYKPSDPEAEDVRQLREALSYDPESGVLRWKVRPTSNVAIGDVAGCSDRRGYVFVRVNRKLYTAHRVAWAIHYGAWPEGDLDHANRDKGDNSITNLRLAPRANNNANGSARNLRGLPKGCYQLKNRNRWYSRIKVAGKTKHLGAFKTAAEAAAAFEREHRRVHGDFSWCEAR